MTQSGFQPQRLEVQVALNAAEDGVADHVAVAQVDDRATLDLQRLAEQPAQAAVGFGRVHLGAARAARGATPAVAAALALAVAVAVVLAFAASQPRDAREV